MILRSNPASYVKQAYRFPRLLSLILRQYPNIAERLKRRHQEYNDMLEFLRNPPQDCEIIEICPPENFAADQFTMDKEVLDQAYQAGRNDGETAIDRWNTPTTAHKPAT